MKSINTNHQLIELSEKKKCTFLVEFFSYDQKKMIYIGDDEILDELVYLVMIGCEKVSNKMQSFKLEDLSINAHGDLKNINYKNENTGIQCKSLELWTEVEFDAYEDRYDEDPNYITVSIFPIVQ